MSYEMLHDHAFMNAAAAVQHVRRTHPVDRECAILLAQTYMQIYVCMYCVSATKG